MDVQEFRQHASEVTRGFSPESVKDLVLRCLAEDMGRRHGDMGTDSELRGLAEWRVCPFIPCASVPRIARFILANRHVV